MPTLPIKQALLSVSDKTGLVYFARRLNAAGVALLSTGGTRKALEDAGLPVRDVADYTGYPEMMDGRVKTLHPLVHGGLLCRRDNPTDVASAKQHGIEMIDLVVVNLYPFEQTIAAGDPPIAEAIEQIDIGGPSMVRSAAKNHAFVAVATDPDQYEAIAEQIETQGGTTAELRRLLAADAFANTARYDTTIAGYFARKTAAEGASEDEPFADRIELSLVRESALRYGENPHQAAALYALAGAPTAALVHGEQLHGKELSYNNWLDLDAAWAAAKALPSPGVAVLKHNNPCGAATAATVGEATELAWAGDPVSAFGSILGFNVEVDEAAALCLAEPGKFVEAIAAPGFTDEAMEVLTTKPKWRNNVRLVKLDTEAAPAGRIVLRAIDGGYLAQTADDGPDEPDTWRCVTEAQPTAEQAADLRFAWAACRHVKSNAIVLARGGMLVGVGAGQMSRVDSVEIAIRKAGDRVRGSVLASDAFFPFEDSIVTAHEAGVAALIQPGGSKRDDEVIEACNRFGIPMVFTGKRHFRH
ncbi:Bifunctional purine biosynthesis protein PurH [Botrimarina colliarenosi]|uniref:Bifunctional purine biosynthesis protein PurH n=1 Tax=Botrimarina colliarenosi TaxID=2528001 RepID=A0A5C6AJG9_9BACT|nr:bifunctional phosphoribosylaminoimidazolecarboxamide formyltransferase/IMP cyclohydrolase [Botrimarina colliarenosi]TWU00185.1 Bifunctional purine biosynthesis protein PurH [Botrimarina colliarenosi]